MSIKKIKNRVAVLGAAVLFSGAAIFSLQAQTLGTGTSIVGPPETGKEVKISRCIKSFSLSKFELELGSSAKCKTGQGQCTTISCT
jgi:hypothetical protein